MPRGISRRRFLRNSGLAALAGAAAGAVRGLPGFAKDPATAAAAPVPSGSALLQTYTTPPARTGTISGSVTIDEGFSVPAGSTLTFDPNVSTTVTVRANVIVLGTLEMKPASPSVIHTLRFEGVNSAGFVGGGLDPLDSDVGLWVMGAGRLDIAGAEKEAWNRIGDHESWASGDELIVTPTAAGDYEGFRSFTKGSGVPTVDNPYGGPASFLKPSNLTFADTFGNVHAANIEAIAAAGITKGCTTVTYCPNNNVTRGQMAAFLRRAMNLPPAPSAGFVDIVGHTFEDDINRVAAAGITQGRTATTFAPDDPVTRGQMAAFISRALNLPSAPSAGFTDTATSTFRADIDKIAAAGITQGCDDNRYCPDDNVTRGQMASFLARAFDLPVPDLEDIVDGTAFRAEVLNMTRNVRIEGTANGKTHVFIRSSVPQSIRYAALRYVAPNFLGGQDATGRYGLHFHHCGDGSRGTLVEGVVVRDTEGHAFVPHHSNGIAMVNCISYETQMDAFWWDSGKDHATHDIVWDRCVAAKVSTGSDHNPHRTAGFALQFGDRNIVTNCVAVGVGGLTDSAGYKWPEFSAGAVWGFGNNVSHNNRRSGFFTWQNDGVDHDVFNFTSYHNGSYGINHGAYLNAYHYGDAVLYGNGIAGVVLKAVNHPDASRDLRFDRIVIDGAGITENLVQNGDHVGIGNPYPPHTKFTDCTMVNSTASKVIVRNTTERSGGPDENSQLFKDLWDFVDCGLNVSDIEFTDTCDPNSLVRVQNGSSAFEVDKSGNRTISPFA